jgi:hypothetical protein
MKSMKVVIAGGRTFDNYDLLKTKCNEILKDYNDIEIVSGTAKGADRLGEMYSKEMGFGLKLFPADWGKYGKSAGMRRNEQMADYSDMLIAFWDGSSKGTKHMIDYSNKKKLNVFVVRY